MPPCKSSCARREVRKTCVRPHSELRFFKRNDRRTLIPLVRSKSPLSHSLESTSIELCFRGKETTCPKICSRKRREESCKTAGGVSRKAREGRLGDKEGGKARGYVVEDLREGRVVKGVVCWGVCTNVYAVERTRAGP